jgi:membrane protein involved in colicin uptake
MDDLIEYAKRRAGILSASSAWGHDDDAALINQLLARIAELERAAAMQTLLDIDGELYDAKGASDDGSGTRAGCCGGVAAERCRAFAG